MKVALFHSLPPGGARRAMFEIVRRLDHDVDLFTLDLGRAERWPALTGQYDLTPYVASRRSLDIRTPPGNRTLRRVWAAEASVLAQRRLAKEIDRGEYDLAVVQHEQFMSSPAVLGYLQTPTVYVCHEPRRQSFEFRSAPAHPRGLAGLASRGYEYSVRRRDIAWARSADVIAANSYFSAESIMRAYGRTAVVSYLGVDTGSFRPGTGRRRGVLAVGGVSPLKGHRELLEAVARIPRSRRPPVTIVFERTHPPYEAEIRALANELHVDLILRGHLQEQELVDAYQGAALTACVAYLEPFGLSALESMSCGTPVVAVQEGGFPESVSQAAGLCVPRCPDALAAAIDDVVSGTRQFVPEAVRENVVGFWSWEAAAERFSSVLDLAVQ